MSPPVVLFWLFLVCTSFTLLWSLAQVTVATSVGVRPVTVRLGNGPRLVAWSMGTTAWQVRLLLFMGGSVEFREEGASDAGSPDPIAQLPLGRYLAAAVLPWAASLLVAMMCLGPMEALRHTATGFTLPFEVTLLSDRIERFVALLRSGEFARAWGLMGAKVTAYNLLPLPAMAGGKVLLAPWRKASPPPAWVSTFTAGTIVAMLFFHLYVAWRVLSSVF